MLSLCKNQLKNYFFVFFCVMLLVYYKLKSEYASFNNDVPKLDLNNKPEKKTLKTNVN